MGAKYVKPMPIIIFLLIIIILILCPAILGIAAIAIGAVLSMLSKLVIPLCVITGSALVLTAIERRQGDNAPKWIKTICAIIEIILIISVWGLLHVSGVYLIADLFYISAIGVMIGIYSEKDHQICTIFKYAFIYGCVYLYFFEYGGFIFDDKSQLVKYSCYVDEGFFDEPGTVIGIIVGLPMIATMFAIPISILIGIVCWIFRIDYNRAVVIDNIKSAASFILKNKYTFLISLVVAIVALYVKYQIQTGGFICDIIMNLCT